MNADWRDLRIRIRKSRQSAVSFCRRDMALLAHLVLTLTILLLFHWRGRRARAAALARVTVVTLPAWPSTALGRSREILVFLPPGYDPARPQPYPTLYLNDGQDMAALQLRETMARLIERGKIAPFIAIAMPTDAARLQEYGTAVAANAQGYGRQAAAYSQFVTAELIPAVQAQFHVSGDPGQTAVWGASLGGLSAFDIGWYHPHLIGMVGVFSGSFWWRAGEAETAVTPNRRIAHEVVRRTAVKPPLRFWLQAATLDETADRDNNGVIDAIQDSRELMAEMARLGFQEGADMVYLEVVGGRHDYETWSRLLPDFLIWAFPPSQSLSLSLS
jgi:enterochelin esterase-like enzyme